LAAVQAALDDYSGFWADVRAYAPTKEYINLTVLVTGSVGLDVVEQVEVVITKVSAGFNCPTYSRTTCSTTSKPTEPVTRTVRFCT
jgi:hypothetical protein